MEVTIETFSVLGNDLFKIMKEKWCANFNSFISEKITLVPGDISCEDLGFKDFDLKEKIYDVAFGINTLEAMHVVNFAKKCFKLKVLVHVSTAYVSKKRRGLVLEKSVDGTSGLVIDVEKKVVGQGLNELIAEGASEKEIKLAMTHLVIKRAKMYGWPNSYVFTIGELLIQHLKKHRKIENGHKRDRDGDCYIFLYPEFIDWKDYFMNTHIHGIVKHVFK
ncbi:hypothetical protein CUMW_273830 [Citrus unshiu]|uniref:Fatty acyl-CoA reductase n=1 Tax=Citrus unshiu TaxID=55188 RepID=A0A2H5MWX2_CITUN|nr:hypothetical protein CUMW_273830 [Citrus unshiu]